MPGFNRELTSNKNTPWNRKKEIEYRQQHGESNNGMFESGVQRFAPLSYDGSAAPTGSVYTAPNGDVKVYQKVVNVIDSEYFNHEVGQMTARRKQLENLAFKFIQAGDQITKKYMGSMYKFLQAGQLNDEEFKSWLRLEGYTEGQITTIVGTIEDKAKGISAFDVDATPNTISLYPSMSKEFTTAIEKMILVLRFYSVIFSDEKPLKNPDLSIPINEQKKGIDTNEYTLDEATRDKVGKRFFDV